MSRLAHLQNNTGSERTGLSDSEHIIVLLTERKKERLAVKVAAVKMTAETITSSRSVRLL